MNKSSLREDSGVPLEPSVKGREEEEEEEEETAAHGEVSICKTFRELRTSERVENIRIRRWQVLLWSPVA